MTISETARRSARGFTPALIEHARHRYEETDETQASIALDLKVDRKTLAKLARSQGWVLRKDRLMRDIPASLQLHAEAANEVTSAAVEAAAAPAIPKDLPDDASVSPTIAARMDFKIKNVWLVKSPFSPAARLVSGEEKVVLPVSGKGCTRSIKLHQDVPSNATDRFTVTLANDAPIAYDRYIFEIEIRFIFNESGNGISAPQSFIFIAWPAQQGLAANVSYERRISAYKYNYHVAKSVREQVQAKISDGVRNWLEYVESAPKEVVDFILNENEPLDKREAAAEFLTRIGSMAKDQAPRLSSAALSGELGKKVRSALEAIDDDNKEAIDLNFVRSDGHAGCEPAPLELLKKRDFPF